MLTMKLVLCEILLGAVDTALVVHAWRMHKVHVAYGPPPLPRALAIAAAALAVHTAAVLPLARVLGMDTGFGRAAVMWHSLLFGILPAWCYGRIVLESLAVSVAGFVFSMRSVRPLRKDFSRARTLLIEGDLEGAAAVYRDYFDESPDDPKPLFEMGRVFEGQERHEAAADLYREIMKRFQGHATQWSKAAYFLADLLEGPLADPQTAIYLFEEILRKAPKTTYAQFSRKRLASALKPSLN